MPALISSLPGTAGLPPFIFFSRSCNSPGNRDAVASLGFAGERAGHRGPPARGLELSRPHEARSCRVTCVLPLPAHWAITHEPWQVPGDVLPRLSRILERVHGRDVRSCLRPLQAWAWERDWNSPPKAGRTSRKITAHSIATRSASGSPLGAIKAWKTRMLTITGASVATASGT